MAMAESSVSSATDTLELGGIAASLDGCGSDIAAQIDGAQLAALACAVARIFGRKKGAVASPGIVGISGISGTAIVTGTAGRASHNQDWATLWAVTTQPQNGPAGNWPICNEATVG